MSNLRELGRNSIGDRLLSMKHMSNSPTSRRHSNDEMKRLIDFENGYESLSDFIAAHFSLPNDKADLPTIIEYNNEGKSIRTERYATNAGPDRNMFGKINKKKVEDKLEELGFQQSSIFTNSAPVYVFYDARWLPSAMFVFSTREMKSGDHYFQGYSFVGPNELGYELIRAMGESLDAAPERFPMITAVKGINEQYGGFSIGDVVALDSSSKMNFAEPEFYPWITVSFKDYFNEFFESSANVLIMVGPPGTGKSTLIRTALRDIKAHGTVIYKTSVLEHPEFVTCCGNISNAHSAAPRPGAFGMTAKDDDEEVIFNEFETLKAYSAKQITRHVVVVEDADLLMGKRSDGNAHMSELLNVTDGIVNRPDIKFIFSTNLDSVDLIDPALLRPGRCFDVLQFGLLTGEQALKIREMKQLPATGIELNGRYKLAQVLNNVTVEKRSEPIVKPRFGFIS